ncbi:hypothetical protein GWN26_11795 [Candidatus Saccharibacteria bacterium]|nr:hypothetical protein [Candidatus Saccharibacteria bacterium]
MSSPQKSFIYGREIGFNYLDLKERPKTSTRLKVESFDQLLNNFKASYFAGALLVQRQMLIDDLAKFFNNSRWNGEDFMLMINRHVVTPEMFLYRLSELLPRFFGLKEIAFFRFHSSAAPAKYNLTKMFNLSGVFLPMGIGSKEHHCRRWLPIQLLKSLAQNKDSEQKSLPQIAAQRSRFINLNEEFFTISLAHGSRLNKATNLSGAMCFRINQPFKDTVKFWDDPAIPIMDVNESCERCGLSQALCSDRAAPAAIHQQAQKIKTREKVLDQLIRDLG